MFDIGAIELLLIAIVAVIVIGPEDMPLAMRTAGRWIGKMRKLSGQFRSGIDSMVREAELEDMEKKWKVQNEKIMRDHPHGTPDEMEPTGAYPPKSAVSAGAEAKVTDEIPAPPAKQPEAPASAKAAETPASDQGPESGPISTPDSATKA